MEWKIVHLDEVPSTNNWLLEHGGKDRTIVVADYQTAGRGCGTNSWESERGKNLLFSMLIHPAEILASKQFYVSMMTANSISKVVTSYVRDVSVKWPNDIYVGDRKICGILIQNTLQGSAIKNSIIGVGLNVNQLCFESDAPNPVSLANLTGRLHDREMVLRQLTEAFEAEWADWEGVRSRYLSLLYRRKGFHRYRDGHGELMAELVTVEDDGRLLLRDVDGHTRHYAFKEVQFII